LTIRQALAKSTLEGQIVKATQMKQVCTETFTKLQRALLPTTSEEEIQDSSSYLLHEAIALRDAITVEQAVYRCYFVANGGPFNPASMQIQAGELTEGNVLVCMFPGVVREHIGGSRDTNCGQVAERVTVAVVKAAVKLKTAFDMKPESAQPSQIDAEVTHLGTLRNLSAEADARGESGLDEQRKGG
jgi:hypothetical protein